MKFQSINRIVLISFAVICVFQSGCNLVNEDRNDDFSVEYFHIKLTDYFIQMNTPTDTVGVNSFSENARHLETYFFSIDEKLSITRFRPDFNPSDTLRITAAGDTIRQNNWALVFKFDLSKFVSFRALEENAEEEPLIEWVSPPFDIRMLD
ncbi:MAG: hypothetical protein U5K69_13530 [Balneolaceae bacterium]|nr:hypothetical protein [Balneolaceae bacterium]